MAIREDARGRILLTGLHQVTITSIDDLLAALNSGSMIRQTDATAINAKSSRSHAVFSLNLVQRKNKTAPTSTKEKRMSVPLEAMSSKADEWITIDSKLHFVDLAGSERLKNTGAQGERAKEGISINAGLASLGKVISQLSSRHAGSHVSYRDSRLTRLLQDSLGGNAITYMIACVTPAEFHLSETLNTVQVRRLASNETRSLMLTLAPSSMLNVRARSRVSRGYNKSLTTATSRRSSIAFEPRWPFSVNRFGTWNGVRSAYTYLRNAPSDRMGGRWTYRISYWTSRRTTPHSVDVTRNSLPRSPRRAIPRRRRTTRLRVQWVAWVKAPSSDSSDRIPSPKP